MVAIRSITYNMPKNFSDENLKKVEKCSRVWDGAYMEVHTQRINLTPFSEPFSTNLFTRITEICERTNIRWFNVPVDLFEAEKPKDVLSSLSQLLAKSGRAFGNIIGIKEKRIRPDIIEEYAGFIDGISRLDISGKDNFRVGFSVNVEYDCPFFPFTQSSGEQSFSIALEMAKDMNDVCKNESYSGLDELRTKIIERLMPQIEQINSIANRVSESSGITFAGFDFSLAPSIDSEGSVITILNSIGVYNFGKSGTMFATAFITDILKYFAKIYKSVGFSGVMYSLLEDLELCKINNERGINIEQLTMVSTMCGCGLDMVPVCGDITANEVKTLCYEIAAISCKLNKPLGIRLLPIQHCKRGVQGYTALKSDADFIANTKVVPLDVNIVDMNDSSFEFKLKNDVVCYL